MQKNTLHHMEKYTKRNQQRRIWQKIVRLLGCAVVFCTTYALILPAITMENTSCGLEEHSHNMDCYRKIDTVDPEMALSLLCTKESLGIHVHDGSCYDAKENIVCGFADYVAHEHLDLCYDGAENLICNLPEVILHVHTEDCYLDVQNPEAASHTHTAACYSYEKSQLICTEPEVQGHIHDADCYPDGQFAETLIDESDKIEIFDETCAPVCGLMEVDGHRHDDSCYVQIEVLSCGYDDIASCGESVLICHKPEVRLHIHEDSCFGTCLDEDNQEITELVCTETEIREHVHTEKCFGTVGGHSDLTCTIPEGNEHKHTELCYGTWQLICELPEHVHEEGCRHRKETEEDTINIEETESDTVVSETETKVGMGAAETESEQESSSEMQNELETEGTIEVSESETELVNETQTEVSEEKLMDEAHSGVLSKESENETQSEVTEESETEKESEKESEVTDAENGTLTCGLTEHAHTDACYEESELVCEQVQHAHTLSCYADASADVETADVWEEILSSVELTGDWAVDVVAIAKTQLGYAESKTNYIVGEDGEATFGYTRYGAWYGDPYGDWCAMFVSFCLHYADVQGVPFESACDRWITALSAERVNLYRTAGEYEPTAGDMIFFDQKEEIAGADHVGIVAEVIPAAEAESTKLVVIEGNSSDMVQAVTYEANNASILGYADLHAAQNRCDVQAVTTHTAQVSGEDYTVTVTYSDLARIPNGAQLTAAEILPGDERYDIYLSKVKDEWNILENGTTAAKVLIDEGADTSSVLRTSADAVTGTLETDFLPQAEDELVEKVTDTEIVEESEGEAAEAAADYTGLKYFRVFDIAFEADGAEVTPEEIVEVKIELADTAAYDYSWETAQFAENGTGTAAAVTDDGSQAGTTTLTYSAESLSDTAVYSNFSEEDLARVQTVIDMIDALPFSKEVEEVLAEYESLGDMEVYEEYCTSVGQEARRVYARYEELGKELQPLVTNIDKLMDLAWLWSASTMAITAEVPIYQINAYNDDPVATMVHSGTVEEKLTDGSGSSGNFGWWHIIFVEENPDTRQLYVADYLSTGEEISKLDCKPTTDNGFLLLLHGALSIEFDIGDPVTVSFDYKNIKSAGYTGTAYGTVTFGSGLKSSKDNSSKLSIVQGADTRDLIEVNLYDYSTQVNTLYKSNQNYPGFQQDEGTKTVYSTASSNFGNNITADLAAGIASLTNQGGAINATHKNLDGTNNVNYPISGAISTQLQDGYPALADGTSLKYLFADNSGYAVKQNSASINGLFQHNPDTGAYTFDSRKNHAQFNPGSDTFTLYEQIISSNFTMYPFGNFLPFNDIVHTSAQASTIDRDYLAEIAGSAEYKYSSLGYGGEYAALASSMKQWIALMDERYPDGWAAGDAINEYFNANVNNGINFNNETELLNKVYSIDYDEPTNFFFGMEMKMNFIQPKGGITGPRGDQEMIYYFTGDDDVWIYIDDILFLDLSGIHRHVGGEIDFVKGEVRYYALDTATGDVSASPYKTVRFSEILGDTDKLNEQGTFKDYSTHTFNFYYMERGAGSGVCRMNFNFPLIEKNSLSVRKEVSAETAEMLGDTNYRFQVLKAADGNSTAEELLIGANVDYAIYDSHENQVGTGVTDENGIFTLKAGQTARFANISQASGNYYVRELLETGEFAQYGAFQIDENKVAPDSAVDVTVGGTTYKAVVSPLKNMADNDTSFVFENQIAVEGFGSLSITKMLISQEDTADSDLKFDFIVTLGGKALPEGVTYAVTAADGNQKESRTVTINEEGQSLVTLSPGETGRIDKILTGTLFTVQESAASAGEYTVRYSGSDGVTTDGNGAFGVISAASNVALTVTNVEHGTGLNLVGSKRLMNPDHAERTYTFFLQQVTGKTEQGSVDLTPVDGGTEQTAQVTISPEQTESEVFSFRLNYIRTQFDSLPAVIYYKITEQADETVSDTRFDKTVYLVEVQVDEEEDGTLTAERTGLWTVAGETGEVTEKGLKEVTPEDTTGTEVSFKNTLLTSLSLRKEIAGEVSTDEDFAFTITLTNAAGTPLTGICPVEKILSDGKADSSVTTVSFDEEGKAYVSLKANESIVIYRIPYGSKWSVTENADGYKVTCKVDQETETDGNAASGTANMAGNEVVFINASSYELPETGGTGTDLYTTAGLLMTCGAAGLLYKRKKRRKEDHE